MATVSFVFVVVVEVEVLDWGEERIAIDLLVRQSVWGVWIAVRVMEQRTAAWQRRGDSAIGADLRLRLLRE